MAKPTQYAKAKLLPDELDQAAFATFDFGGRDGDEEQEERDGKSVVEAGFHIERLTNAHGHARAVHDNLSQAGVGRRKDSAQNSRFPDR